MTFEVSYHPEAITELRDDVARYERSGRGPGRSLWASVDAAIDRVLDWPEAGTVWPGWDGVPVVRSRRVPDFPYRLVYLVHRTLKTGHLAVAEFRSHRIMALVRAANGHEAYLAIIAEGVPDPQVGCPIQKSVTR